VTNSVERIEKTDAAGDRVQKHRTEITKVREGRRLPCVVEGIEIIGCNTASGGKVERGELEIGGCRTPRARDIGYAGGSVRAFRTQ